MKKFYALYDKRDNFVSCGYCAEEIGVTYDAFYRFLHKNKQSNGAKIFEIPLLPQKDVFEKEDILFLEEEGNKPYSQKELAEKYQLTKNTIYKITGKGGKISAILKKNTYNMQKSEKK